MSVNSNTYFGYSGCLAVIDNDVRSAFGHAGSALCFAVDKCRSITADDLTKIITDFYKEGEIISARSILDGYCD